MKKIKVKTKLKKFYKKNKLIVNTAATVFIVGAVILTTFLVIANNNKLKEYSTDTYTIKYDKSWKIKDKTQNTVELKHKSKSKINIEIVTLKEENKYLESEDLIEELLYSVGIENKEYKLLQKQESNITKYNYNGYKILYETEDNQVLVVLAKKADKVLLFTYEAKNDYFDIVYDSVQNILYNFKIEDKTYEISKSVDIKTEEIKWSENEKLLKKVKKNKDYVIANNNYEIVVSAPSNFKIKTFESTYGTYEFSGLDKGSINMDISIYNRNLYQYLETDETLGTLYYEYSYQRKTDSYKKFKETLSTYDSKYKSYIYKASYEYKLLNKNQKHENVILVYEINKNHIVVIKIESVDNKISKQLIDKIKIKKATNYSRYISNEIEDEKKVAVLKRFSDYKRTKYDEIKIKLPVSYEELDYESNIYQERYYGINYDKKNDIYQYNVNYSLTGNTITPDRVISNIWISTQGAYQPLVYEKTVTYNEKEYDVYFGGYTNNGAGFGQPTSTTSHYVNKKVLIHKLKTGGCLVIEVDGNNIEISEQLLNDLTNIDIMNKEYK